MSTALIRPGVQAGQRWAMIAAAPATCGVAMEVPVRRVYHWSTGSPRAVPAARAAMMSTPGATVRAAVAAPGVETVCSPGPSLPAAITNRVR